MQCFLCKKNNFETVYSLKSKKILRCKNDGLFVTENNNLKDDYGIKYFNIPPHPPSANNKYFLEKLRLIQSFTSPKSRAQPRDEGGLTILDVGCGWGNFLEVLKKKSINYKGIDNSTEAINICRSKNLNCQKTLLQDLVRSDKSMYDAITFFQVIEHIQNPLPILAAAKKVLKPNGIILITTPNNDSPIRKILGDKWSVYNDPTHYVFYDMNSLRKTLLLGDFKKIKIKLDTVRFLSLQYILMRLSIKLKFKLLNNLPVPTDPWGDLETIAQK